MELRNVRALRGPNVWSKRTLLQLELELAGWLTPARFAAYRRTLKDRFPAALMGVDSTEPAEIAPECAFAGWFAGAILSLQTAAGSHVTFGRVQELSTTSTYRLAVEYREERVGRQALEVAERFFAAIDRDEPFELAHAIAELRSLDQQIRLGPSTGSIVRAATQRGIPYRRLNEHSLVQLGHGSRQRKILAAETDQTSAIAEQIVQDKQLTKDLLSAVGAPVPLGREVTSPDDAVAAAEALGYPVVVKPQDGSQGRGVAVNLRTPAQVVAAYHVAAERYDRILVEEYAPGADYRLLIIDNRLVAAARREPPLVTGDGRRSVAELVADVNLDPRRGEDHATSLSKIPLDATALGVLAEQGLNTASIPAAGQIVLLRRNANLSTGGTAADVTDLVHPDVAARAIDAVRMVGLDIAGVDIIALDISRPLEEQRGKIIEINAAPGLRMHLEPSSGEGRPVGEAIVDMLFPTGDSGRIPIVAVTGVNGKTTTTRLTAHILRCWGKRTGMTCTEGVYVDDRLIDTGDCSGPKSAHKILSNPLVDAAVLETARGGILREGLGFDQSSVSIVTNIGQGDHLGLNGIETLEQLARVKRVIVEHVAPQGSAVLNAEDPLVAAMAEHATGKVLFFARSAEHPLLTRHRQGGGKVVFVREQSLIAAEGAWEAKIADLASIPLTMGGTIGFQVENAMAAAAGAWTLGVPFQTIRYALETFVNNSRTVPARFNVVRCNGATIVIDYGHNVSALEALLQAFAAIPHERRVIVYTAAGDRRDRDILDQAALIADSFDHWVLYEDACTRGRADGEIIALMRQGIAGGKRLRTTEETRGELNAIDKALAALQPGDLILIQADQVELAIRHVHQQLAAMNWESTWNPPTLAARR